MNAIELNTTAAQLIEVKAQIKALQERQAELENAIKGYMIDTGAEKVTGDGWKAAWINVTRSTFDSKSFKADHSDLYTAYSKPQVTTRFTFNN